MRSSERKRGANRVGIGCGVVLLIIAVLFIVNNRLPSQNIPTPVMPNPNARDLLLQAASTAQNGMVRGAGKALPSLAKQQAMALADAPALGAMHQALNYPYRELPARKFSTLFPHYAQLRDLARSVAFDSSVEAASEHWDAASELALDDVQMGEMVPHGSLLIGDLVGIACSAIGRSEAWKDLDYVSAKEARQAMVRLQRCDALHVPYKDTLTEEKWFGLSGMIETLRHVNGPMGLMQGNGIDRMEGIGMTLYVMVLGKGRVLTNLRNTYDRVIADAAKPYSANARPLAPPNDLFSKILIPVLNGGRLKELDDLAQIRLLEVAYALRAYRLEHGDYPSGLNDLVTAGYLKAIPPDPFRPGMPVLYRRDGASYLLYSVGPDGVDNGGEPIYDATRSTYSNRAAYYVGENSKGDIVAGRNP